MTVKDFCYFTGANLKTIYRKIAKYKDNELRGHITKRKGHGLELDDYAEWLARNNGTSWKIKMADDIDRFIIDDIKSFTRDDWNEILK